MVLIEKIIDEAMEKRSIGYSFNEWNEANFKSFKRFN